MTQKQAVLTIPLGVSLLGDGEDRGAGQVCPVLQRMGIWTGDSPMLCSLENEKPKPQSEVEIKKNILLT